MSHRNTLLISFGGLIILLILYTLTTLGYMGDNPVGNTGNYIEPLVVPAGYAFSVWGPIYLALIAFPIFQWFQRQKGHELWKEIRLWYAFNVVCNGLWLVFASYDWQWTTVAIIIFMLYSLYKINALLTQIKTDGGEVNFWAERLGFSMYFAWITLATALNISSALSFYAWSGWGISELVWAVVILSVAAGITAAVFWKYKDLAYAAVVIWAFAALIVKHLDSQPVLLWLSAAVIVLFVALIVFIQQRPGLTAYQ